MLALRLVRETGYAVHHADICAGTVCAKCGVRNLTRIVDYCSVCGERAATEDTSRSGTPHDSTRKSLQVRRRQRHRLLS